MQIISYLSVAILATAAVATPVAQFGEHFGPGPVTAIHVGEGEHCANNVFPKRLCNTNFFCLLDSTDPASGGVCAKDFKPHFGPGPVIAIGVPKGGKCSDKVFPKRVCDEGLVCAEGICIDKNVS
ncbi:hypothetical protein BDK51DRAFT_34848 [Blyttiomyces helicus]|uniref:Uncharacterized protein n=1 Tax=Blyttiomyces helicus TaxID=388810 RepID=A0A4P9W2F6_9FUNG|nr:hypothetical protein BDK51DRAFT_34848 [Blyttiomyces helicus]|eukprot:RKO86401.1 hypothetical protein BDK51DRAFT_34848 [Blyttiomyces helicus]